MNEKSGTLANPSAQVDLDPYEAKYMRGDATLYHSKARTAWQRPAVNGTCALFIIILGAMVGRPLFGLFWGAVIALIGIFFAVIRVTVSPAAVVIQYGVLGPTIPIESIESVEAIVHDYRSPLRWGISPTWRGEWLYTIAGDEGRAVKIVWRNARGRRRVHIIGSLQPEQLAEAIRTAQNAAASTPRLKLMQQSPPDHGGGRGSAVDPAFGTNTSD